MAQPAFVQWLVPLEHFYVDRDVIGETFVVGTRGGIRVEVEFPEAHAHVARAFRDIPQIFSVQAFS